MTDRTTINVPQDTHKEAREVKEEFNDSWPDVLAFYARHRPEVSVSDGGSPQFDWSKFDEKLQHHLAEWEITVNMDQLDLSGTDLDENDVRNIVTREIESKVHERARDI